MKKYLYVLVSIFTTAAIITFYLLVISKKPEIQQGYIPFEKPYSIQPVFGEEKENDIDYQLHWPGLMTTDDDGNVYIMDGGNSRIVKFNSKGEYVTSWGQYGFAPKDFGFNGMDAGKICYKNGKVYVYDKYLSRVQVFDKDGQYLEGFPLKEYSCYLSISVDSQERIYFSHSIDLKSDNTITVYSRTNKGYKYLKSIVPVPFVVSKKDVAKLSGKYQSLVFTKTRSRIKIDDKDNIYQVFIHYPLIRKYSKDWELLWAKTYFDISKILPHSRSRVTIEYLEYPEPADVNIDWLRNEDTFRSFGTNFSLDILNKRMLIDAFHYGQILVLDFDGDILGAYYPSDILNKNPEDLVKSYTYSREVVPAWNLCYDSSTGRGYFTHIFESLFYTGNLNH